MGAPRKILVVDDALEFVQLAKHAFEAKSFETIFASSKIQGLKKVESEHPDLIIIGTVAPRGDGFKLHKEIKDNPAYRNIPMLVVDAKPEDSVQKGWRKDEDLMLESEDCIARPVEPRTLLDRVEKLLS